MKYQAPIYYLPLLLFVCLLAVAYGAMTTSPSFTPKPFCEPNAESFNHFISPDSGAPALSRYSFVRHEQ